ncbi:MAG: hypothetical protein J5694_05010 [Erysipelotrichaceae bacterium]|nr:hypothetical protein [Erysipelotrichaceae bacterium]
MKKLIRSFLIIALILGCGFAAANQHADAREWQAEHLHIHDDVTLPKYQLGDVLKKCPGCGRRNTYIIVEQGQIPTCTRGGFMWCRCTNDECGYEALEQLAPLGHNYKETITKQPTCTESGTAKYTCTRCGKNYTETVKALGHNYEYTETEPTCTEDGHKIGTCKRCGDVTDEVFPALGHDFTEYTVVTPATCEADGLQEAICMRCSHVDQQVIPATGHAFPDEWTVVKKAGYLVSGLRQKVCANCGMVIEEVIPAKIPLPVTITTVTAAAAGAGLLVLKKMRAARKLFKPSVETKTVVIRSDNEDLIKLLKDRLYLSVTACDQEKMLETLEDKSPDLLICQIDDAKNLKALLREKRKQIKNLEEAARKKEEGQQAEEKPVALAETAVGLIVNKDLMTSEEKTLRKAVKDKLVTDYLSEESGNYDALVKFVLPILKPDLKSDESLDNFSKIADLLGIPGVSALVNVYTSGRDIKATLQEGELGVSETATIIGDIASILGLDTVGSIAGLVGDVEDIASAVKDDSGAHEQKKGVKAIKDIAEVVNDIVE